MDLWILAVGMGLVAFLYSSIGHAGASGYIAVMALCSVPAAQIKPIALALNIVVSLLASWNFYRAGHLNPKLLLPLVLGSVPMAFLGGYLKLPAHWFQVLVGLVLWFSAYRLWLKARVEKTGQPPGRFILAGTGAGLGLLAGLSGTGGGIFLTPWMLWRGWATTKTVAAVSALFIFCNSVAGLAGHFAAVQDFPAFGLWLLPVVAGGGWFGSWLGSRRYSAFWIRRLLAAVLLIAGMKLIFIP
jgi:uncharacterized membrane protein YfcA